MGHVLVAVFLGIYIGVAGEPEFQRHGVGHQPAEVEAQRISTESRTFPVQVGNGGVDGNPLAFFKENSVFAVQTQGGGVVTETGGK